ncbi:MAG: acyl-CoA synthetase [Rhodospirillales bacterium]|nr:acyl-CoA synthetase [Rhodospirillales bacterium]
MPSLFSPPARFNIARYCLAEHAAARPEKTALIIAGADGAERRWCYAEIDGMVRRLAGGLLTLGLPSGARVMIRTDNDLPYVLAFFAAMAAGYVPLPSSAALTGDEAEFLLNDSAAGAVVLSDRLGLAHEVPPSVRVLDDVGISRLAETAPAIDYADTSAEDPAFLIYTSGTVGRPKGVLHAHRAAWGRRPMYQGWYGIGADDVVLHAGAFNWTYTLGVGLIDPWANGATAVLYNGPADPAVWPELIARFGVSIFATVPSPYRRILKYGRFSADGLRPLRHGLTAGEALPPSVQQAWRDVTGTPLYEALGMSEISTYVSTGPGMPIKPGSPGRPQPGRRVAILIADAPDGEARPARAGEPGLLAVHRSDPGLMLGYWRRPEEEALVYRGEWFCGGDMAHMDDDGYVWFHGRHDDILNPGGYRLSPLEIEGVLAQHPMVQEVAVGELALSPELKILAAFVVADGARDEAALLAWAKQHLAGYKVPRRVVFVPQLPRNRAGKLLRRDLPASVDAGQAPARSKA